MSCDCSGGGQEMQRGRGRTTRRDFKNRAGQPGSSTTGLVKLMHVSYKKLMNLIFNFLSF
jgi:hypothetical protein